MKHIFFDLDGTLLPMDQDEFVRAYFGALCRKLAPYGYEPKKLINAVMKGTSAMVVNDGSRTNEDVFWSEFKKILGEGVEAHKPVFDDFYLNEFHTVRAACGYNKCVKATLDALKGDGYTLVLATNPIFPSEAQRARLSWTGADVNQFELITSYENSHGCKPNTAYYTEILDKLGYAASDCVMIGNDVTEDMAAAKLGMSVFLCTDCIINKDSEDISKYPHGKFSAVLDFVRSL